jgi:hypothetical protein
MHHGGKWFKGEHQAILDRPTFERVQALLASNRITRRIKHSESGALLRGKLFDDKGNAMSPSFSSKNGVRYRFYVSTAMNGRRHKAGSVTRISASEIENLVEASLGEKTEVPKDEILDNVESITVSAGRIRLSLKQANGRRASIDIPWTPRPKGATQIHPATPDESIDQKLLKSIVRAHAWLGDLACGRHVSIEDLGAAVKLHSKVIRQGLRFAFLAPNLMKNAIDGTALVRLNQIPQLLPLSWSEQHRLLRCISN